MATSINIALHFSGSIPPGFDANANIQLAKQYAATHTPYEVVDWFNHMVRNNKDEHLPQNVSWDFKQIDPKYADFGNFWYGFVGKGIGISDLGLKAAAGYAQGKSDGLDAAAARRRTLTDWVDFGDNPGDQGWIRSGISASVTTGVAAPDRITSVTLAMANLSGEIVNVQGTPPRPVYDGTAASTDGLPTAILEYVDPHTVRVLAGGSLYKVAEFESKSGNSISAEDLRIFNSIVDPKRLGISSLIMVPTRVGDSLRMQFDNVSYALDRRTGEYEFSTQDVEGNTVRWQRTIGSDGAYKDRYVVTSAGDGSIIQENFTPVADVYGVDFETENPTNIYSLTTPDASIANWNATPDSTSSGPSSLGNTLVSNADYTASINYSLLGDVNTAGGNAAVINYAISDGLRPGNSNLGLNIGASTGQGLDIPNTDPLAGAVDYSLYGTSLNNAAASNFQLTPTDPLVLDLNGDGVKLTNYTDAPVLFDADNDGGSLEQTGWVSSPDGIVVHDLNGDGKINNIRETLSEYYNGVVGSAGMAGTKPYANGFAALKSLDSNSDNQFTASDTAWSNLRVWQDANHDGKTDAGELKTFADLGITALNLASTAQSGEVRDGNEILARGSFTQTVSGVSTTREAIAANFLANPAGSTITASGSGVIVATESVAGSAGNTGVITAFVSQNTLSTVSETLNAVTLGVRHLTGGAGNDTLTGDAQNNWLAGGLGADALSGGAGDDVLLMDANDTVVDGGDGLDLAQVVGSAGVTLNLSASNIEIAVGGDGNDVFIGGGRSTVFVRGGAGDDMLIGGAANDVLSGEDGADLIDGGAGNDLIRGHRGQDQLLGGAGDDVLDGGLEDDQLSGGSGADVLIGGRGDDRVDGGDGIDVAEFSGSYADYRITKVSDAYGVSTFRVVDTGNSTINLNDGTTSTLVGKTLTITGAVEKAFGGNGNDTLIGNALTNVLVRGRGNDMLSGGRKKPLIGMWTGCRQPMKIASAWCGTQASSALLGRRSCPVSSLRMSNARIAWITRSINIPQGKPCFYPSF